MPRSAQIGILGAGPAGARAAELLARHGVEVVLFDPKAPWEKPCGGGLTPPLFDELPDFAEVKDFARPIDRVRVETSPEEGFTVSLDRPMWIVPRIALGRWQLDRALAAGAELVPLRVKSIERVPAGWQLETDEGVFQVQYLIGADGAASLVRRVAAPEFSVELAPTRVAYPHSAGPTPDTVVMQFYGGIAGYLWDFPRPGHRSVGIGVPNGTWRRATLDEEVDRYRDSSEPCDCPGLERGGAVIGTAQLGHGDFSAIAGEGFALLGDAAGFADPLTGEGIQNALRSAELFVLAWTSGDPGRYPELARRAFAREFGVARWLRHTVFESERGLALIRRALVSDVAYAAVSATVNAINEHDGSVLRFFRKSARVLRHLRRGESAAEREARVAVPCGCSQPAVQEVRPCDHEVTVP